MPELMLRVIDDIWQLARHIVSDDYDEALARLHRYLPLTVHEVASGTQCWTWRVPNKWGCREAYIEAGGERLVDVADHPLHIVYGSQPIDRMVSHEELMQHLTWKDDRPGAIPFEFKYYEPDWGFCIPRNWLPRFTAAEYRVKIDVVDEPGTLKIGEHFIQGESDRCIVIVAHLCHPAMVNDDLAGVAVSVDIARRLQNPYYSYRFLYLPETIGSVAYLATHEEVISDLAAGIFLEMLATPGPLVLQHSYEHTARIDHMASYVLGQLQPGLQEGAFRTIIGNDEMVFDGPGVRVPMISLSRWPYPEYHTSDDNPNLVVPESLVEAREGVLELLRYLEADYVPVRTFRGPLFLSGYGLWVDWRVDRKLNRALEWVMNNLEGELSVSELAARAEVDFWQLKAWLDRALSFGLIRKEPAL
jgi:aminopeptidase-like protein